MFIDVMEIDAAQYALISMEMSFNKSFLQVYQQGQDYLDKPPLLFWLSALSFSTLGISNFTYKLPSIILALVGIFSTYKFTLFWYSKEKAIIAALILATSQALFLITNDIRTDTNLLGLVMFGIWQMSAFLHTNQWKNLIFASIGFGFAMMAKGPIALVIPAAAFGTEFLLKRTWSNIFKPHWLVFLAIVAITLLPMSYGLYSQFDLHPEKEVYNLKGPSGLKFFYWTQSFGRITGENYWKDDTTFGYFFHTILWDFQPWIFFFYVAIFRRIWLLIKNKFDKNTLVEYVSLGGFVLIFIAFSLSKFKLPHYIFVILPFAAIITADFLLDLKNEVATKLAGIQFKVLHLFWLLIFASFLVVFPIQNLILPCLMILLYGIFWLLYKHTTTPNLRIIFISAFTAMALNFLMSVYFYPNLLQYQPTSQAGHWITNNQIPLNQFFYFKHSSFSLDFYAKRITPGTDIQNIGQLKKGTYVYAKDEDYLQIIENNIKHKIIKEFDNYKVTALDLQFLYYKTRPQTLGKAYLIALE